MFLFLLLVLLAAVIYVFIEAKKIRFDVVDVKPSVKWENLKDGVLIKVVVRAENRGSLNFDIVVEESEIYADGKLVAVLREPAVLYIRPNKSTNSTLVYKVVDAKQLIKTALKGIMSKDTRITVKAKPSILIAGIKIPLPEKTFEKHHRTLTGFYVKAEDYSYARHHVYSSSNDISQREPQILPFQFFPGHSSRSPVLLYHWTSTSRRSVLPGQVLLQTAFRPA